MADYLDPDAVAELLGIDRDAAYLLVRRRELPSIKMGIGGRVERAAALRYGHRH
jgi:excisionase family DNA binding protein